MPFLKPRGHKSSFVGKSTFVLREGLYGLFCTGTLRKLHTTQVRLNKMFCSRSLISLQLKDALVVAITDWIWRALHYRPFVLDVFRHGKREVVETVCLVIFPLISLKKYQVSSLNEKGVKKKEGK